MNREVRDRVAVTSAAPWWHGEAAIPFSQVPNELPVRGTGKRFSAASTSRYGRDGLYGVRMRRFRAGGRGWFTTKEEVARWVAAINAICGGDV
jgi:hypothetical protein